MIYSPTELNRKSWNQFIHSVLWVENTLNGVVCNRVPHRNTLLHRSSISLVNPSLKPTIINAFKGIINTMFISLFISNQIIGTKSLVAFYLHLAIPAGRRAVVIARPDHIVRTR